MHSVFAEYDNIKPDKSTDNHLIEDSHHYTDSCQLQVKLLSAVMDSVLISGELDKPITFVVDPSVCICVYPFILKPCWEPFEIFSESDSKQQTELSITNNIFVCLSVRRALQLYCIFCEIFCFLDSGLSSDIKGHIFHSVNRIDPSLLKLFSVFY